MHPLVRKIKKGSNHFSNKQKLNGQSRMSNFVIMPSSVVNLYDFVDTNVARLCRGLPIEKGSIEEDLLLNLPYRDSLEFVPVFRPIPISVIAKPGTNASDTWLNMTWLTPTYDVAPREALEYKWLPYSDAEEVCASYIINVPEVTLCQDTQQYILCAADLCGLHSAVNLAYI